MVVATAIRLVVGCLDVRVVQMVSGIVSVGSYGGPPPPVPLTGKEPLDEDIDNGRFP